MQTIRRDWLMRQVEAGKMEARLDMYIEHDGPAYEFGKADDPWKPARIRHPKFTTHERGYDYCSDSDSIEGFFNMHECDFSRGSRVYAPSKEGPFHLRVHSNLSYDLRFKAEKGVAV